MQIKFLAKEFANATVGTPNEAEWGILLVRFILGPTRLRSMSKKAVQELVDNLTTTYNEHADSGCDKCECGNKYWENDRCIDCRAKFSIKKHRHVEEPNRDDAKRASYSVSCPHCMSPPGNRCVSSSYRTLSDPHNARMRVQT